MRQRNSDDGSISPDGRGGDEIPDLPDRAEGHLAREPATIRAGGTRVRLGHGGGHRLPEIAWHQDLLVQHMRIPIRQGERRQTLEDAAVRRLALWHREFEQGVQMRQQQAQADSREEGVAGVGRVPMGVVQQLRGVAHGPL